MPVPCLGARPLRMTSNLLRQRPESNRIALLYCHHIALSTTTKGHNWSRRQPRYPVTRAKMRGGTCWASRARCDWTHDPRSSLTNLLLERYLELPGSTLPRNCRVFIPSLPSLLSFLSSYSVSFHILHSEFVLNGNFWHLLIFAMNKTLFHRS